MDDDSRGAGSAARPPAKALDPFLGQPGAVRGRALPIKRPASRKPPHIAPVEAHVAETAAAAQREGGRTRKTAARRHQAALSTFSTSDGGRGRRREFPRRRGIRGMLRFNEENVVLAFSRKEIKETLELINVSRIMIEAKSLIK